jgi:hypothetical protein
MILKIFSSFPTLSCVKKIGNPLKIICNRIIIKIIGDKTIKAMKAKTKSINLFKNKDRKSVV